MITILLHEDFGHADHGWLKSLFHFNFADYNDQSKSNYGVLRVLNDDLIQPGTGFDTHGHRDMEIISYVVDGELTHADSMGHEETLRRGQVQYLSAGTGVKHAEHNYSPNLARFLQIWIVPDKTGHKPAYGDHCFAWNDRVNNFLRLVSSKAGSAPIKINQDVEIFASFLEAGHVLNFEIATDRQVYLVNIEGELSVNGQLLRSRDALMADQETLTLKTDQSAHFLLIEMPLMLLLV